MLCAEYLRVPNEQDLNQLLDRHAEIGFLVALDSHDCAGWLLHCGAGADQRQILENQGTRKSRWNV